MTEQGNEFIEKVGNIGYIDKSNLDEIIPQFQKLSLEDQYEILCRESKDILPRITGDWHWIFCNNGLFDVKNTGTGIIDILNYKCPKGSTIGDLPKKIYLKLSSYGNLSELIGNLEVFKDEEGKIDKKGILKYLSEPFIELHGTDDEYKVLDYFDPDEDRKRNNRSYGIVF